MSMWAVVAVAMGVRHYHAGIQRVGSLGMSRDLSLSGSHLRLRTSPIESLWSGCCRHCLAALLASSRHVASFPRVVSAPGLRAFERRLRRAFLTSRSAKSGGATAATLQVFPAFCIRRSVRTATLPKLGETLAEKLGRRRRWPPQGKCAPGFPSFARCSLEVLLSMISIQLQSRCP